MAAKTLDRCIPGMHAHRLYRHIHTTIFDQFRPGPAVNAGERSESATAMTLDSRIPRMRVLRIHHHLHTTRGDYVRPAIPVESEDLKVMTLDGHIARMLAHRLHRHLHTTCGNDLRLETETGDVEREGETASYLD